MQTLPLAVGGTITPALTAPVDAPPPVDPPPFDPAPFDPPPFDTPLFETPLARTALDRARMRAVIPLDIVTFVAACPACGQDCEWTQERQETRVRSRMNCPCTS